jgi:hypothetical protein
MARANDLLRYDVPAAGVIPLQNEGQKEHDSRPYGKNHKRVNIRLRIGLRLNTLINTGVARQARAVSVHSRRGQIMREIVDGRLKAGIAVADVPDKNLLVELGAPRQ